MNIFTRFTRFLSQWSQDESLRAFVERWDTLEAMIVGVYRAGAVAPADEAIYAQTRAWLDEAYSRWQEDLRPFWQKSKVGGKLGHQDPFKFLLRHERAADFVDNWSAMQHLPAAREALNGLIVAVTGAE